MNLDELERGYLPVDGNRWIPTALKDKIYHAFPYLLALARDGERYRERFSDSETGGLVVQENAGEQKPVAWMLKTGHGTKIVEVKPPCEVDLWKPLYLAPTDSGREKG